LCKTLVNLLKQPHRHLYGYSDDFIEDITLVALHHSLDRIQRPSLLALKPKRNIFFADGCLSYQKATALLKWNQSRERYSFLLKQEKLLASIAW
jgi:hypothetical protein